MKNHRSKAALSITLLTLLGLAGCTGGGAPTDTNEGGEITFQTWSLNNEKFTPFFEELVETYEKENPGTTVNWVDQPADGYEDKILQQAESGQLPDVINLPPEYAYSLTSADQLLDLEGESKIIDQYVPGGVEAYQYEGSEGTYGLPWYLGTELNYWNKKLLDKGGVSAPPTSLDETLDAAEKLAAAGEPTISGVPGVKYLQTVGVVKDFYKDGKFVFNTPEAAAVIDRYKKLHKEGGVSPEALQSAGTAEANISTFNKGGVAWTTSGPNYLDKDLSVNAPNLLGNVEVTKSFGDPPLFVQGVSVSKNSKSPEQALAFAEFVTNDKNQIAFAKLAPGFLPGTVKANEDPSAYVESSDIEQQNTANSLAAEQLKSAKQTGVPQYTEAMENYAKQQIALAISGDLTGQEALDKAIKFADENIAK